MNNGPAVGAGACGGPPPRGRGRRCRADDGVRRACTSSLGSSVATGSANYKSELAYAWCVRAHGVPDFPDCPIHRSGSGTSAHLNGKPDSPAARANDACKHLLPAGGRSTAAPPARRQPAWPPWRLTAWPPGRRVTHRGSSGPPTASSRCLIAGSPAAGRPSCCWSFPVRDGSPSGYRHPGAAAATDIRQDLARFDSLFGLPAARLQVVNTLAHAASPWLASTEEVGDTEIVHALAPDAAIREVLIPSPYTASLGRVERGRRRRPAARPRAGWRDLAQRRRGRAVLHPG